MLFYFTPLSVFIIREFLNLNAYKKQVCVQDGLYCAHWNECGPDLMQGISVTIGNISCTYYHHLSGIVDLPYCTIYTHSKTKMFPKCLNNDYRALNFLILITLYKSCH